MLGLAKENQNWVNALKNWKLSLVSIIGITAFWILFTLAFAAISGDFKANFLKVGAWIFVCFVAPTFIAPIIYFILKIKNYYIFTMCFYYGTLAIVAFVHKFISPVENADQVIVCFLVSFIVCYVVNKIIELEKKVAELLCYKNTAEPYMDFFKQKADKCGMGMHDYLEAIKEFEKEYGESGAEPGNGTHKGAGH